MKRAAAKTVSPVPVEPVTIARVPRMLEPLAMAYVLMLAVGFFVFRQPWVMTRGNALSAERATFVTMNAATLTGFTQSRNVSDYTIWGQVAALALTIGGALFAFLAGGWAVTRIARLRYSDAKIAAAACAAIVIAALLGAAALAGPGVSLFAGAFDGISAIGNSGLYLGKLPASNFWPVHVILLPLALLGGWGIPLILEIFDAIFGRRALSRHAQITIAMTCSVFVIGAAALFAAHWPWESQVQQIFADSAAAALNSRSAGFAFTNLATLDRVAQWLILGLMIIGAASGGSAGGLKVTTPFVIARGVRRALRRETVEKIFGVAMIWFGTYFAIVLLTLLALLSTQPEMAADRLLFLAVSAVSNVGLSHDPVAITGPGLIVLSVAMLLGRVAPIVVLWCTIRAAAESDIAAG